MIDCENLLEKEIILTDEHKEIDEVCVSTLRQLAKRDDFNLEVFKLLSDNLKKVCDEFSEVSSLIDSYHTTVAHITESGEDIVTEGGDQIISE